MKTEDILKHLTCGQEQIDGPYSSGRRIALIPCPQGAPVMLMCSETPLDERDSAAKRIVDRIQEVIKPLLGIEAIAVGLDLREYSRRDPANQLLLTLMLEAGIRKTRRILEGGGILPPQEPRVVEPTGDGALVFFTALDHYDSRGLPEAQSCTQCRRAPKRSEHDWPCSLWHLRKRTIEADHFLEAVDRAMAFVFALNAIVSNDSNRCADPASLPRSGASAAGGSTPPAYPVECRFAVTWGEVLLRTDEGRAVLYTLGGGALRCSGNALITCNRILMTDKGSHFLIHDDLLRKLEPHGGLASVCQGQWRHRLHCALLPKSTVKSGAYQFADAFGFYDDGPLLRALGNPYQEPREYYIGSHDIRSIQLETLS
jgi:class 3 adenylate cyclase